MRVILAALLLCVSIPVHASWLMPQVPASYTRHLAHVSGNHLHYGACDKFGRKQCGCTASILTFGKILPGLPAVSEWLRQFARTTPHVGAAAIWPGQHVEIVTAVHGRTVDTRGSVGWRNVPVSRLVFVDPSRRRYAGL